MLARVLNENFIPIMQQKIIDAGFDNVRVLPRGGDNEVLFCPRKEDMMTITLKLLIFSVVSLLRCVLCLWQRIMCPKEVFGFRFMEFLYMFGILNSLSLFTHLVGDF